MNAEQLSTWKEIVRECKPGAYTRADAAQACCDVIMAVNTLVELVTPELAALLERLANCTLPNTFGVPDALRQCVRDRKAARILAARIRETLEETE